MGCSPPQPLGWLRPWTGLVKEQHIQKQVGCMAGFLHIFDRHQFHAGKRFYSAKRLPPPPVVESASETEKSAPPSPESGNPTSNTPPSIPPLPLPMFESRGVGIKSTWRFRKEAPRLSLDSRATTDAKGSLHPKEIPTTDDDNNINSTDEGGGQHHHHRSPSVIARLMGLEPLPSSSQPNKHPELRRSASESRVSKDLFQSRFLPNGAVFNSKPNQSHVTPVDVQHPDPRNYSNKNAPKSQGNGRLNRGGVNSTPQWRAPPQRKSFFDSGDIFPEPKQIVTIHGEVDKRIRMRGVNEPSQDLETLKQILEALQLKGLLHSRTSSQQNQILHRNFVYDESPIVLMKPSRSPISAPINSRMGNDYSPRSGRRNYSVAAGGSQSPQRERNTRSPTRTSRSPIPTARTVKPKQLLSVHTTTQRRRTNESPENRNASPVHSPKLNTRRTGTDPTAVNRLTTRSKKPASEIHPKVNASNVVVLEDESSSNSGSSITTTSTDTERLKVVEEHTDRRSLLKRCDKLLHIIAEVSATDAQPSPVSVLDSSFYKDESLTPSPVTTKRIIDFKDHQSSELEEEIYSPPISPIRSKNIETSYGSDFVYISDILRAIHYLPENSDVFQSLEKHQNLQGFDARLDRKLIFDTIDEILSRNNRLPPWSITTLSLDKVWSEFERIQERDSVDDLFESICRVLKKDLAGDAATGWVECSVEMSEAVLDIERLIFKDLICDSIGDLAELASRDTSSVVPRRKLVF